MDDLPPKIGICNETLEQIHMFEWVLNEAGYETICLESSKVQSIDKRIEYVRNWLRHNRPQIVIYDISIPYEEKWKTFIEIKKLEEARDCRFILTTTDNDNLIKFRTQLVEPVRVINLPCNISELLFEVESEIIYLKETREDHPPSIEQGF